MTAKQTQNSICGRLAVAPNSVNMQLNQALSGEK